MIIYVATFTIAFFGSIVSGLVGGGGSLLTAPYLILIGLPPPVAIATTKCSSLGLTVGALRKFISSGHIHWPHVPYKVILSGVAAVLGPALLVNLLPTILPQLLGGIMISSALFLLFQYQQDATSHPVSKTKEAIGDVLYFLVLFLQSAFGGGVGVLRIIILMVFFGLNTLQAHATARTSGIVTATISLVSYLLYGLIDYRHGFALAAGSLFGGYIGAHLAIKHGHRLARLAIGFFVILLGLLLIIR